MNKLLRIKPLWALLLYLVMDTICVGMGMGVPFFCILLGFPVGWYIVQYVTASPIPARAALRRVLYFALVTAGITFVVMLVLWTPFAVQYFDPSRDLSQTGIPMILYEPRASFIGWIILMILISPFLQLLAMVFSAYLSLLDRLSKGRLIPDQLT